MSIVAWLMLGLAAGFVANKLVDRLECETRLVRRDGRADTLGHAYRPGEGAFIDIVLGIIGAMAGGFLFATFGVTPVTGLNAASLLVAVTGAVVVLISYHAVTCRRAA